LAITSRDTCGFNRLSGTQAINAQELNAILDAAFEKSGDKLTGSVTVKGVVFYKRKGETWATAQINLEKIAKILGKTIGSYELQEIKLNELAITSNDIYGFNRLSGTQKINAQKLKTILETEYEKSGDKLAGSVTVEGVVFYKRKIGNYPIWATVQSNLKKIAKILGVTFALVALLDDELAITNTDTSGLNRLSGTQRINAQNLKAILDAAFEKSGDKLTGSVTVKGIVFYKRKRGDHTIWATAKSNLKLVAKLLGKELRPE
jgi:uncharacterized protein YaaR (DUF327 family)